MNIEEAREVASKALQHLSESLAQGESCVLRNYLAAMGKFHRYSASNILLITAQRPEATRVAGYQTWRKLHRQVARGAKGIVIFAPLVRRTVDSNGCGLEIEREKLVGYRAAEVFDVVDTTGEPLPTLTQFEGNPGEYLERLKATGHSIRMLSGIFDEHSSRARAMLRGENYLAAGSRTGRGIPRAHARSGAFTAALHRAPRRNHQEHPGNRGGGGRLCGWPSHRTRNQFRILGLCEVVRRRQGHSRPIPAAYPAGEHGDPLRNYASVGRPTPLCGARSTGLDT